MQVAHSGVWCSCCGAEEQAAGRGARCPQPVSWWQCRRPGRRGRRAGRRAQQAPCRPHRPRPRRGCEARALVSGARRGSAGWRLPGGACCGELGARCASGRRERARQRPPPPRALGSHAAATAAGLPCGSARGSLLPLAAVHRGGSATVGRRQGPRMEGGGASGCAARCLGSPAPARQTRATRRPERTGKAVPFGCPPPSLAHRGGRAADAEPCGWGALGQTGAGYLCGSAHRRSRPPPPHPSPFAHALVAPSPAAGTATAGAAAAPSTAAVAAVASGAAAAGGGWRPPQQRRWLGCSPPPSTSTASAPRVATAHALDGPPSGVRASRMAVKVRWWTPLSRTV